MSNLHPRRLKRAQIQQLQDDLDAVRDGVMQTLGEQDVAHIRRMIRRARNSAIVGRTLLGIGIDPISFVVGVGALAHAKIVENMEVGHNVMHGQYDWTHDPALNSQHYEWDNVCDAGMWRHFHNYEHHTYTNILGKDRDFGYTILRLSDEQKWHPLNLLQPVWNGILALAFEFGVGGHDVQAEKYIHGELSLAQVKARARPFARKIRRQVVKDYVLFPLLTVWNAPRVLAGNFLANVTRNLWSYAIIFCGHFPNGTEVFAAEDCENETRGDWYYRQICGSANITGGRAFHLLSGHLSHQIEHHLFPDMPAHRYADIAPQVQAICARYGLPYNTASFWHQYGTVLGKVMRHALPSRPLRAPAQVSLPTPEPA
ncbi:acyl-CoA desaturase [Sinimarinibacterium sp. NLF-5-8]|uniref:fatty acid desaturase family protein n=1 Tax=Sinimarinibacterium sp. NLF-5-8 TaxID=2698684 RepID=UPI00137BF174|nr:acyl-CoA desaturase [Sinimarinibacterium sp. NLF-5-8]QHS09338.1 acyl-CoA desaturase [Sinimarinibacterium sp. NLF-5-8]